LESWKSGTSITLSSRKLWLRKAKASFHLYRRLIFIFLFIFLSSTLISLSYMQSPIITTAQNVILSIAAPFIKMIEAPFDWAKQGKDYLSSWANARHQAETLAIENKQLKETICSMDALREANTVLEKFLNVKTRLKTPLITVPVLSYPGRPFIKSLLISAGKAENIKPQQVVINERGLVGRVINVGQGISHILLLTDVNSHVPVVLKGTDTHAILEGANEGLPFLKYVQTKLFQVGDIVETSGHGGIFPAKIPVGKVEKIEGDRVFVRLFSDLESLSFVMLTDPVIDDEIHTLVAHDAFDAA
jgi:rod shape-determining protein MreC